MTHHIPTIGTLESCHQNAYVPDVHGYKYVR